MQEYKINQDTKNLSMAQEEHDVFDSGPFPESAVAAKQ